MAWTKKEQDSQATVTGNDASASALMKEHMDHNGSSSGYEAALADYQEEVAHGLRRHVQKVTRDIIFAVCEESVLSLIQVCFSHNIFVLCLSI